MIYLLHEKAQQDLEEYLQHVGAEDPVAAARQDQRIHAALARLANHPGIGRKARLRGWARQIRSFKLSNVPLRVFYTEMSGGGIYVARLYHSARKPLP